MAGTLINQHAQELYSQPSQAHKVSRVAIAKLSPAKRRALVICLSAGGTLERHRGLWVPLEDDANTGIARVTMNSLARDRFVVFIRHGRRASARLTERGRQVAMAVHEMEEERVQTCALSSPKVSP